MKILLIEADFNRNIGKRQISKINSSNPVFGINLLASILRNIGHEVLVLDSFFAYLKNKFSEKINLIKSTRLILEKENNIDCVGISLTSPTRNYGIRIAKEIKNFDSKILIIGGGPHISIMQEMFLERYSNIFDILVIGEGEITLLQIINSIDTNQSLEQIEGIVLRNKRGEIIKTNPRRNLNNNELNNTDIIPFTEYPQYQEIFNFGNINTISLITTRGCPYRCNFCYSPQLWEKYRFQEPKRVSEEIKFLLNKYHIKNLRFQDDTLTYNKQRAIDIFKEIKKLNSSLSLYMHTRFDCIDENLIKNYSEAGGKKIYFGLESGSEKIRDAMNKNIRMTNDEIIDICKIIKKNKINIGIWIILGYPGETEDELDDTLNLLSIINPDEVTCNPVHVHPNTALFKQCLKEKKYNINDWLNEKSDFFPFHRGQKGRKLVTLCLEIEKKYSNKQIRTTLEYELETSLGKEIKL